MSKLIQLCQKLSKYAQIQATISKICPNVVKCIQKSSNSSMGSQGFPSMTSNVPIYCICPPPLSHSIFTLCVRSCSVMCSTKRYCAQFYEEAARLWKNIQKGNKTLAEFITKSEDSMGEPMTPDDLTKAGAVAIDVDEQQKDMRNKFKMMTTIIQKL